MPEPCLGLIGEGAFDDAVYSTLINRVLQRNAFIFFRNGQGSNLYRFLPDLLRDLMQINAGSPADKVLVVKDSEGRNPVEVERRLEQVVQPFQDAFRGKIRVTVVHHAVETLLLADPVAIAASIRLGVPGLTGDLELLQHPKRRLMKLLSQHSISYTSDIAREIALHARLEILRNRSPSFRRLEQAILH